MPDRPIIPVPAPDSDNLESPPAVDADGKTPFLDSGEPDVAVDGGTGYEATPSTFGPYRRGEMLHQTAMGFVCRCEGGPPSSAPRVIKVLQPSPGLYDATTTEERAAAFVARAELQRRITLDQGATHWAVVHAHGRLPGGGAYAVADYLPWTAHRLAVLRMRLKPDLLHAVVDGLLGGLFELRDLAGRWHGNLRPGNVLLTDPADRKRLVVRLTDPASVAGPGSDAADLRAIGSLLYELVLHEPVPHMFVGPVAETPQWAQLGSADGRKWRDVCDKLLFPGGPQLTLEELDAVVRAGRRPRGRTQVLTPLPGKKGTFGGLPTPDLSNVANGSDSAANVPGPETAGPTLSADAFGYDADAGGGRRMPALAKLLMLAAAVVVVAGTAAVVAWRTGGGKAPVVDGGGGTGGTNGGGGGTVAVTPPVVPLSPEAEADRKVEEQLKLADAELTAGRFDGALAALAEAKRIGRKPAEVARRARAAEDGRDVVAGSAALAAAVPDVSAAHRLAEAVLKRTPDHPGAVELTQRVDAYCRALSEETAALVRSGQPASLAAARDKLRTLLLQAPWYPGGRALKQQVDGIVNGWVEQADRDDKGRRFDAALAGYHRALTVEPERSNLSERIGRTQARAQADVGYRQATAPAESAVAAGDWRRAATLYAQAVNADGANEPAAAGKARLEARVRRLEQDAATQEAAGQFDAAAATADSLLARDPGNEPAKAIKARAREKRSAGEPR